MARQVVKNLAPKIGVTEESGVATPFLGGVLTGTGEGTSSWLVPVGEEFDESAHDNHDHSDVQGVPDDLFVGIFATVEDFNVGVISKYGDDPTPEGAYGYVGTTEVFDLYVYFYEDGWAIFSATEESQWKTPVSSLPELGEGIEGDCCLVIGENLIYTYHIDGWIVAAPNTGLLDETSHDLLDHEGLTGVPSIAGLLDETAHDLLNHSGLPGEAWKGTIANVAYLPTNIATHISWGEVAGSFSGTRLLDQILWIPLVNIPANVSYYHLFLWVGWDAGYSDSILLTFRKDNGSGQPNTVAMMGQMTVTKPTSGPTLTVGGITFYRCEVISSVSNTGAEAGIGWLQIGSKAHVHVLTTAIADAGVGYYRDYALNAVTNAAVSMSLNYLGGTKYVDMCYSTADGCIYGRTGLYTSWAKVTSFVWNTDAATPHMQVNHAGIPGVPSIAGLLNETAHDLLDHTGLTGIPSVTGLLDETAHDLLDHTGLTGVGGGSEYFNDPVAAFANLPASGDDGDLIVVKDSHKIYVWDAEAATPCWRETNREVVKENITVDASSWRNFQISLIDRSMLNILDFECIISKIMVTAIDGNATPALDYNIELFTDEARSVYAYWAQNIDDVIFEDKIPFLWEGGSTVYGRIVNNKAAAITDLDIRIKFRV